METDMLMDVISLLLFILSAALLVHAARAAARRFGGELGDAFWIFIAALYLQISAIPQFLSLFHLLNRYGFLACQVLIFIFLFLWRKCRSGVQEETLKRESGSGGLHGMEIPLFVLGALLILVSCGLRVYSPLFQWDVLNYHASRPLYWMQHGTMAAYPTANDRQIVFAFGTDLIFAWPVLFTRSEFAGRMVYWLGFPAAAAGIHLVLRAMGLARTWCLVGVIVLASTPIVFDFSLTLEPLVWLALFGLGAGYFALRAAQGGLDKSLPVLGLGLFSVLAGNAKTNGVVLIPAGAVVIALLAARTSRPFAHIAKAYRTWLIAVAAGMLLSGLGFLLVQNKVLYGHFTASELRKKENVAELSLYQLYVHTVRTAAVLAEVPAPVGQKTLEDLGNRVIGLLGADRPLPREEEWDWVRPYRYEVAQRPGKYNFGITGIVLLLVLLASILSGLAGIIRKGLAGSLKGCLASNRLPYAIMAFSLLLLTAYLLRWIASGTRSFIAPGAVCVLPLAIAWWVSGPVKKTAGIACSAALLLFALVYGAAQANLLIRTASATGLDWKAIAYARATPSTLKFHHPIVEQNVPEGATLIILVDKNFHDYTLFGRRYTRRIRQVVEPLDSPALARLQKDHPGAYIYVHQKRFAHNLDLLARDPGLSEVARSGQAVLFRIKSVDAEE
jgi:hypothetical protein